MPGIGVDASAITVLYHTKTYDWASCGGSFQDYSFFQTLGDRGNVKKRSQQQNVGRKEDPVGVHHG
jgi:hypothetical protein